MNNSTSKSRFVRLVGLLALLVLLMTIVSSVGAATYGTLEIGSDTTLSEDHYGNIIITADNVTLDCAGHAVIGPDSGSGILLENRTAVTVKNCLVIGFEFGFELTDASNNVLKDNEATGNTEDGFVLLRAHGNRFERNTAYESNGGFWLQYSSGNILVNNTASNLSSWPGFSLGNSSQNKLIENTANDNTVGGYLVYYSSDNVLKSNVANNNGGNGFRIGYAHNNQFIGNTANNNTTYTWKNGIGFNVFYSDWNLFRNNQANDNEVGGFSVLGSTGNTLIANVSASNGNGIFVAASIQTTINENQVVHNHGSGIHLVYGSDSNSLSGNISEGNAGWGIVIQSSSSNRVTDNVANSNTYTGLGILEVSYDNFLSDNDAMENGADGFYVGYSAGNELRGNRANLNAWNGFTIQASSGTRLVDNQAMHNDSSGFVLVDGPEETLSEFNSFELNHACQNQYYDGADYSAGSNNTWLDNKFCTFYDGQPS